MQKSKSGISVMSIILAMSVFSNATFSNNLTRYILKKQGWENRQSNIASQSQTTTQSSSKVQAPATTTASTQNTINTQVSQPQLQQTVQNSQSQPGTLGYFNHPISVVGNTTLLGAISILMNDSNIQVQINKDVKDVPITLSVNTNSIQQFIENVCYSADVWCDYYAKTNTLVIKKTRDILLSYNPEGFVQFELGGSGTGSSSSSGTGMGGSGGSGSGGSGSGSSSSASANATTGSTSTGSSQSSSSDTGSSFTYMTQNVPYFEAVEYLKKVLHIPMIPSQTGFILTRVTPSQYREIKKYFDNLYANQQVVFARIDLYRVDLSKQFQWGINWSELSYILNPANGINTTLQTGVTLDQLQGDSGTITIAGNVRSNNPNVNGVLKALETFGKVHKIDSWYYQMVTGTPVPFRDYTDINYFTLSQSQGQSSTTTGASVNTIEVGFRGSLAIYKMGKHYYVDGAIDLSSVAGYTTESADGISLSVPNTRGQSFRIATVIPSLNATLVVGGFRIAGINNSEERIPGAADVPVLGYLFKGKNDQSTDSEFIAVITLSPASYGPNKLVQKEQKFFGNLRIVKD